MKKENQKFKLHFLESYWCDCILLEYKNKFALIDTGDLEHQENINSYLKKRGIENLEFILITHFHRDHYGNLEFLLNNYKVKAVYLKEYSGYDSTTSWGAIADDEYRKSEMEKFQRAVKISQDKSKYINLDKMTNIVFEGIKLSLFNTGNVLKDAYENKNLCYFHQYVANENFNSVSIYFTVNNKKIYLGGDLLEKRFDISPKFVSNEEIAKRIGSPIDVYKAAHHGMNKENNMEILEMLSPSTIVVTNHIEDLPPDSNIVKFADTNNKTLIFTTEDIVLTI